jgi:S1-C subfamily serine protease
MLIGLMVLMLCVDFTTKAQRTQSPEILIIDLSKRIPDNPYQKEYEKMLYPTVRIKTTNSTGSGVIIGDYIISAAHVVGANSDVRCEIWDGDGYTIQDARVVITDTLKDLALITIHNSSLVTHTYSATLAPRNYKPYIFNPVYAVGCSLGMKPRPSYGIISAIENTYWGISAPVLPGNSGGPVYDARTYEVIGIAVWINTCQGQLVPTMVGIVPIQKVYEFLDKARSESLLFESSKDTDGR